MIKSRIAVLFSLLLLVAAQAALPVSAQSLQDQTQASVIGAGQFQLSDGTIIPFVYAAIRDDEGHVGGEFIQRQPGLVYVGRVTCLSVDTVNHRAWVGGVIVYSNDPTPDHLAGDAIWFRTVDYGHGNPPDRSTVFGFKGAAGFDTSAAYCAGMPWAAGDARTWPVINGDIRVRG